MVWGIRSEIVKKLVRQFCEAWFEARDVEKTVGYLDEDLDFIGTGEQEAASGRGSDARVYRRGYSGIGRTVFGRFSCDESPFFTSGSEFCFY